MFEKKAKVLTIDNLAKLCDVRTGFELDGKTKTVVDKRKIRKAKTPKDILPVTTQQNAIGPKPVFVAPEKPKSPANYKNFSRTNKTPKKSKPKIKPPVSNELRRLEFNTGNDIKWL
ncbi:MAG: hypothetical protein KAS32_15465 [Candidatus Peribacteraceae bacterium]|nr:hypothetical protein [Candidatus Peribacteraceae bacterium]